VVVPPSDEGLGLEVDTSDEEIKERVNDKHHVQSAEDDGSSSNLEVYHTLLLGSIKATRIFKG